MQRYHRMRETVFDLYTERDALPWYFRAIATLASWLVLAGYVVFALAAASGSNNIKISRTSWTAIGGVCLVIGYVTITAIAFFCHSILFLFDAVLLPMITASAMGVIVTITDHALHKHVPGSSQAYYYAPLIIGAISTTVSGVLSYIVFRRITKFKEKDMMRRQRVHRPERGSYTSYGDATSTTELASPGHFWSANNLPEDEAQRRQLLRLLLNREAAEAPRKEHRNSQTTYHINLPGEHGQQTGLQVIDTGMRPRSGSLPSSPAKWSILKKFRGKGESSNSQTFKTSRERRREEIERLSVQPSPSPGFDSRWSQDAGLIPAVSPPATHSYSPNPVWPSDGSRYV
jgi:hypothetical protein